MRIVAVARRVARWELDGRGAARGLRERRALLVEIATASGARGHGEAAPLPGLSPDTLDDAERAVAALAARIPLDAGDGLDAFAALAALLAPAAPAARFAIEAALSGALAAERGTTLAALLDLAAGAPGAPGLPPSVVVDDPDDPDAARRAVAAGARALKLKVGPGGDLEQVRAIAAAAPGVRLRLDANRTWPRATVRERLAALADLPVDYVEEPCAGSHELLAEALPVPIALDESLAGLAPEALDAALDAPGLGALVLKPTLLGLGGAIELAARARAAGVPAIATHGLESPTGRAACAALAEALAGSEDTARAPAILTRTRTLSFACVAALSNPRAHRDPAARCVLATPTAETIAAVHAALAERRPIALLHPKLPAAELARRRAEVEAARLPAGAAVILFTSGSTGPGRGVVLSRDSLDAAADASARHLGWRAEDRWLLALPSAHAGGLAIAIRCLAARRPIVLAEDGDPLAPRLAGATLASLVPAQLAALLDDPAWRPPPALRALLLGGAAAPPSLLAAAAARGVPFLATYGMTETLGQVATMPPDRAGDPAAPLVALPGVSLAAGTPAAPASIRVRAPMLAPCYLDGAPIAPELATADLGFLDAGGALHVVGRADDVIVTGGAKVHPLEVEAVLAATPGVRAALVFAVPDARWGQIVGAAIAAAPGFDLAAAAARWHAALPPPARPRRIALAADLPRSPTGKPDRRAAARLPHAPLHYRGAPP